jgi:hypothetical protein
MKRKTDPELEAAKAREHVLSVLLQCFAGNEKPDAVEKVKANEGKYVLRLFRASGASGGYLSVTFHYGKQRPDTSGWLFDNFRQHINNLPSGPLSDAVYRLYNRRNQIATKTD